MLSPSMKTSACSLMELGLVMKKYARVRWKRETDVMIVLADMRAMVAFGSLWEWYLDVLGSSVLCASQYEAFASRKEGGTGSRKGGAQEAKKKRSCV